jgi:hypothetical protein
MADQQQHGHHEHHEQLQQDPQAPDHVIQAHGYAAHDPSGILTPFSFSRR